MAHPSGGPSTPTYTTSRDVPDEHRDLRNSVNSLRAQIEPHDKLAIDVPDIRDRLAAVARRFRQHRSREADLIYEAVNISLRAGD